jgi:hypothetical protein
MARNQEKAQSMLARFRAAQEEEIKGVVQKRYVWQSFDECSMVQVQRLLRSAFPRPVLNHLH